MAVVVPKKESPKFDSYHHLVPSSNAHHAGPYTLDSSGMILQVDLDSAPTSDPAGDSSQGNWRYPGRLDRATVRRMLFLASSAISPINQADTHHAGTDIPVQSDTTQCLRMGGGSEKDTLPGQPPTLIPTTAMSISTRVPAQAHNEGEHSAIAGKRRIPVPGIMLEDGGAYCYFGLVPPLVQRHRLIGASPQLSPRFLPTLLIPSHDGAFSGSFRSESLFSYLITVYVCINTADIQVRI